MKFFHIFLFIILCALVICGTCSYSAANWNKNIQQKHNKSAQEIIDLAKSEFDNYNYKKAISLYKQALRLKPSNPEDIYLYIGISYNLSDQYKKAIKPLNKSIEISSDNSSAFYNRGFAYYKLKQTDKAKEDFKKAIEINKPIYQHEIKKSRNLLEHIEFLESCE